MVSRWFPQARRISPPVDERDYVSRNDHNAWLIRRYVEGDRVVSSSREFQAEYPDLPLGTWMLSNYRGKYGREIDELVEFKPRELTPKEFDWKDPRRTGIGGRWNDVVRYAQWLKEGHRPPPITVVQHESGDLVISDGHRRTAAADLAGKPVRAWVSWTVMHPRKSGGTVPVGLTYEIAHDLPLQENSAQMATRLKRYVPNPAKAPVQTRVHAKGLVPIDKQQARDLATRVADVFGQIHFRDDEQSLGENRTQPWPKDVGDIRIMDVRGRKILVPVELRISTPPDVDRPTRIYIPRGEITHRHYGEDHPGIPIQIRIYLNADKSPKQIRDARAAVEKEVYSVLVHELTHASDVLPTPRQQRRERPREPLLQYINRPLEVRAFKRQVAEDVEDGLERLHQQGVVVPPTAAVVERLLEESPTWQNIRWQLDPENQREIRRSAADVVRLFHEGT